MPILLVTAILATGQVAAPLGRSDEKPVVLLPDYGAEVRAFNDPLEHEISWHRHLVNASMHDERKASSPRPRENDWFFVDYIDRTNYDSAHGFFKHRGIRHDGYGDHEYQETLALAEEGARKLLWDNGIARCPSGERVVAPGFNMSNPQWAKARGFNCFIVCNNAPRWSAMIDYGWLRSPLIAYAISQDNIGGPISRTGAGSLGRFCDYCNLKFNHHLELTGRLPEYRRRYKNIRDYVTGNEKLMSVLKQLPPHVRWSVGKLKPAFEQLYEDEVLAEYHKFLHIAHLHAFMGYYRDNQLVAARFGREYDVHGNQGGGWPGFDPYSVLISNFVDTIWFESYGLTDYDLLQRGRINAWGPWRFQLGDAMALGRKPVFFMSKVWTKKPAVIELEMAEHCAGGGLLPTPFAAYRDKPDCEELLRRYRHFRHDHRAVFSRIGRRPHSQVGVIYSVPTMMYTGKIPDNTCLNQISGVARALQEGHLQYDAVIFNHPDIYPDYLSAEDLKRYRLIVVPGARCLSDAQVERLERFLGDGGVIAKVGEIGTHDENYRRRPKSVLERLRAKGKVVDLLGGRLFHFHHESKGTEAYNEIPGLMDLAVETVRESLGGDTIITGDMPKLLWAKVWSHWGDYASVHLVNYDMDYEAAKARPTKPFRLTFRMPEGIDAEEALFLDPDGGERNLDLRREGNRVVLDVPSVRIYGVVLVGKRGLDRVRSGLMQGDAFVARAEYACDGDWGEVADLANRMKALRKPLNEESDAATAQEYAVGAQQLLVNASKHQDERLFAEHRRAVDTSVAVLALNFGVAGDHKPWKAVTPQTLYTEKLGFGWIDRNDQAPTVPTPEEVYYSRGGKWRKPDAELLNSVQKGGMAFWPHEKQPVPAPLQRNLRSNAQHRFRIDLPDGLYEFSLVRSSSYFRVCGMVRSGDDVVLLDVPFRFGEVSRADFVAQVKDRHVVLSFGGTMGWGLSAIVIRRAAEARPDPLATGALRSWLVSPRYANPEWWPIRQVGFSPEDRLAAPETAGWKPFTAPGAGIGVVELATNTTADAGDVVYATAVIDSAVEKTAILHAGFTSSAQVWLNGEQVGYIPNQKGLLRNELRAEVRLRKGANRLHIKLQKFWERRWMFYASLLAQDSVLRITQQDQ